MDSRPKHAQNLTMAGHTEAEGYAASLRQMARWVEEALDDGTPYDQRIDLGDIDIDELRAAADFIERSSTASLPPQVQGEPNDARVRELTDAMARNEAADAEFMGRTDRLLRRGVSGVVQGETQSSAANMNISPFIAVGDGDICIDCDGHGLYPSGNRCKSCGGTGAVASGDGMRRQPVPASSAVDAASRMENTDGPAFP